jgi:Biotin-lipoyl like
MTIKYLSGFLLLMLFANCKNATPQNDTYTNSKTDVEVVKPFVKSLKIWHTYQGVSKYLNISSVKSPISGVIQKVKILVGQEVENNDILFIIKPKELAALEHANLDKNLINISPVKIKAHQSNFITAVNFQVGDYVQEGDVLATNVKKNSLVVIAYVPLTEEVKLNSSCRVKLPNGTILKGLFERKLSQNSLFNQKQPYVVRLLKFQFLAQDMNLTVKSLNGEIKNGFFISKKSLYANEEQTNFWIMKMINDSTAIKTPVNPGYQDDSIIQLLNPALKLSNKIISNGGYGLSDTAQVHIIHPKKLN